MTFIDDTTADVEYEDGSVYRMTGMKFAGDLTPPDAIGGAGVAKVIEFEGSIAREAEGIKCPCGGYAEKVETTPEERGKYGCGKSYSCCDRAFVCAICKARLVGKADAPEVFYD